MKKVRGATSNKFPDELGGAVAGLAHSAKIAVNRAALRNNAAKMSDGELVRPTGDFRIGDHNRASLMPELPLAEDTWARANDTDGAVDGTWTASDSFERAEGKYGEQKDEKISELSSITQPILKLYDQLGGFIKR